MAPRQSTQSRPTTFVPYFLLAFACKSTRALFIPNEDSDAHTALDTHSVKTPYLKRQFFSSSSSFPTTSSSSSSFAFFPGSSSSVFSPTASSFRPAFTLSASIPFIDASIITGSDSFSSSDGFSFTSSRPQSTSSELPFLTSNTDIIPTVSESVVSSSVAATSVPTFPVDGGSKNPAIPIIIGTVTGCLIAILLVLCLIFLRKRRRRRLKEAEQLKVEKAFDSEAGFHLLVDTGSEPTGVKPYTALPTSQLVVYPDEKTRAPEDLLAVPAKTTTATQSSAGTSSGSISSAPVSPVSEYTTPTSALSQQALLDQLNLLRAQIQHVEALAGISASGTSNQASSLQDSSEPPPEYSDANLAYTRTGEKGTGLP